MTFLSKTILPRGFKASGVSAGIKKSGKPDLALFYSEISAKAACVFTSNKIKAAPLKLNIRLLKTNKSFRAIIVNSGNANCFTGRAGLKDANAVAGFLAKELKVRPASILVNSTGIIGKRLAVDKIKSSVPKLVKGLSKSGIAQAKKAILTTDTFSKEAGAKFLIGNKPVTILGVAKGAGMISPDMATLLVFILTDADISQNALKAVLSESVNNSFNLITVDGCMSTNDSVMLLANGAAGNAIITSGKNLTIFTRVLNSVCLELAKMVVKDGEGTTKFIEITVDKAKNENEAKKAALAVANSNLFKTAVYGENPNFGRIAAAIGASGIDVSEEGLKIKVSTIDKKEIKVYCAINKGKAKATVYTSDLTPEYIKINAEYN
ncbi:MAG: bifunctional glutamate N-acetyltransferase/amino-acid acetyltransferase ArgJ [Candidatus Omnitrophica bacterium]|nr:bifunctional glutamate N-acetyltransferase/amino-acid acetyltransferase ArgJ [Candidatus Omnitrophota bacterium]